jgi:hypothetical protein
MLAIGTKLYGYCGGWFGRDAYDTKRIEAVGVDWVVARAWGGPGVFFASGKLVHEALSVFTVEPKDGD